MYSYGDPDASTDADARSGYSFNRPAFVTQKALVSDEICIYTNFCFSCQLTFKPETAGFQSEDIPLHKGV